MTKDELEKWHEILRILDVDLEYPDELHNSHNEYPLAPDHLTCERGVDKLTPNLLNKTNYVLHCENLKLYESLDIIISKINRGIKFKESAWMKKYIDLNTNLRTKAKNEFEKDFFKLMNNAVFGKAMENVRNRVNIKLINNEAKLKKID